MKTTPFDKYPKDKAKTLLGGIPFFNDLLVRDADQYQLLLKHSSFIEIGGAEVLIKKGGVDKTLYFLLKGEMSIYVEENPGWRSTPIGKLAQGQVLGALTVITGQPRIATVAVEKGAGECIVLATDVAPFGNLEDFSRISMTTKLAIYRLAINNTRFKLETYKAKDPKHALAETYMKVPKFSGPRDSIEELRHHAEHAPALARLLQQFNDLINKKS